MAVKFQKPETQPDRNQAGFFSGGASKTDPVVSFQESTMAATATRETNLKSIFGSYHEYLSNARDWEPQIEIEANTDSLVFEGGSCIGCGQQATCEVAEGPVCDECRNECGECESCKEPTIELHEVDKHHPGIRPYKVNMCGLCKELDEEEWD